MSAIAVPVVAAAYLVGLTPTAAIVAGRRGHDPTSEGSRNPGASNVARVAGHRAGAVVLLADMVKGFLPTLAGLALSGRPLAAGCWVAAVLGHVLPVTRRFRGGKGVATVAGGCFVLYPLVALGLMTTFALIAQVGRRASVASLTIAVVLPIVVAVTGHPAWELAVVVGLALLVVARHAENIGRLRRGEEPAFAKTRRAA